MTITPDIAERFIKKINKTNSCWLWTAGFGNFGYGHFNVTHTKGMGAHRFSWELFKGKIPDGKYILHKCNNPPCVNPEHLYPGTQKENIRDVIKNGKFIYGSKHPLSKLKEEDIPKIIEFSKSGMHQRKIASMFGVHQAVIFRVIHRKGWGHVQIPHNPLMVEI